MSTPSISSNLLPYELIQTQFETLDLLHSLYPLDQEFTLISPSTFDSLDSLRTRYLTTTNTSSTTTNAHEKGMDRLEFEIRLKIDNIHEVEVGIRLELKEKGNHQLGWERLLKWHLKQPDFVSRSQYQALFESLPSPVAADASERVEQGSTAEYLMDLFELIKVKFEELLRSRKENDRKTTLLNYVDEGQVELEVRVWYLFQSLSTRGKRDDIVNWAKEYNLTGFVLAGKPAILCLEGKSSKIDEYMSEIKSVSWSDIPSFQKKVSERHRTVIDPDIEGEGRKFAEMSEITELIGKGGHLNNRIDMAQVRDFLISKGLGQVFGLVVGNGSF